MSKPVWIIGLAGLLLSACGGGGRSAPAPTAPGSPTITQITPGDRALTVAFTPPLSDGGSPISQYSASCRGGILDNPSNTAAASPIVVTGLTNGREYSCSVTARNAVGESASSLAVAATPYTTPPAPTLGGVTVGDGFIEVALTAPDEDGGNKILDYELACTTEGDSKTVSAASSPLKLSGLRNGSAYACTVRARNAAGKGAAANLPTSTPRTIPSAPTVSGVTADVGSLVVAFTAPSSDGGAVITRYTARCIYNGISRFNQAAVSPIVVDGLPNGVAASCAVSATNVAGESAYSAAVLGAPRDFAADAQFTAALDSAGRRVTLSFRDVFPSGTQYRIESQAAGASFVSRAVIDGTGGAGATLSWSADLSESATFRVIALRAGRADVALKTAQGATTTAVAVSTVAPAIVIDRSEPLTGTVRLSIGNGVAYPLVEWFINLNRLGNVAGTAGNPINWNTESIASGEHLILARIQTATNSFVEVRRTVRVANVSLTARLEEPTAGEIQIIARASSTAGIASVEATIDGTSLGKVTSPNCATCAAPSESYRWILDKGRYPSGSYAIRVTAVDREGISKSVDLTLQVRNPPTLTLDTPGDYDIVHSRLTVRGRVGSDRPGTIRTVITLGSVTVLDTTSVNFEAGFDLSGVPGGAYTLTARSTDSAGVQQSVARQVIVTESADRLYTPVLSLGAGVTLLYSDGAQILYRNAAGAYLVQALSGGAPVTLAGAESVEFATDWQIASGRVYAQGRAGDCTTRCIYEWDSAGSRRNLSSANPFGSVSGTRCSDEDPIVRGNIVMWANWLCGKGAYTLFDRSSGSYSKIDAPAGANYIGNNQFDVSTSGGSVIAYIWAQMGGEGMSSTFDVFRHTGGASTRLSSPGTRNVYPRTNGTRVVWEQSPTGGNADGSVALVSAGPQTIASKVTQWALTPQVLAWREITSATPGDFGTVRYEYGLRAETNGTIATISTRSSAALYAATRSWVLFGEEGKFYRFDAAQGTRSLVIEAGPQGLWANDGVVVFSLGGGKIYRVQ